MKKVFIVLSLIVIFIVGCGRSNETESVIDDFEGKNSMLQTTNDSLLKERKELTKRLEEKETTISELNTVNEELMTQITSLNQEIVNFELDENNVAEDELINVDEIKIGDSLDGYKITNIENTSKKFSISLDGYFLLEGDFFRSELGGTIISFIGTESTKDQPFKTKIRIGEYECNINNNFGIVNDGFLKEQLGEEIYNRILNENKSIHGVAVFKAYSFTGYWDSELDVDAELVGIIKLEVNEI